MTGLILQMRNVFAYAAAAAHQTDVIAWRWSDDGGWRNGVACEWLVKCVRLTANGLPVTYMQQTNSHVQASHKYNKYTFSYGNRWSSTMCVHGTHPGHPAVTRTATVQVTFYLNWRYDMATVTEWVRHCLIESTL